MPRCRWAMSPPIILVFSFCVTTAGVDHCAEEDHGCEQLCLNTEESFVCQCSEGFLINEDLKTCSRESVPFHPSLTCEVSSRSEKCEDCGGQRLAPLSSALCSKEIRRCPRVTAGLGARWGRKAQRPRDPLTWLLGFAGADYCLLSDHGCEYACINTDTSFACQCPEGHVLRSDGKTCASECSQIWRQVGLGIGDPWVTEDPQVMGDPGGGAQADR